MVDGTMDSDGRVVETDDAIATGTFSIDDAKYTKGTSYLAADGIWQFLQSVPLQANCRAWLTEFPQYNPHDAGFHFFTERYPPPVIADLVTEDIMDRTSYFNLTKRNGRTFHHQKRINSKWYRQRH
jgi:hypothetical protein